MRVVEPASELCARDAWVRTGSRKTDRRGFMNLRVAKYSVDPALTDIRGEFSVEDAEANLGGNAGCRSLNRERQPFLFLWAENCVFIRDLGAAKCQRYGD